MASMDGKVRSTDQRSAFPFQSRFSLIPREDCEILLPPAYGRGRFAVLQRFGTENIVSRAGDNCYMVALLRIEPSVPGSLYMRV